MGGPALVIELAEAVPAAVVERLRGFLAESSAWFEERRTGGYDLNVLAHRLGIKDSGEVDERRPRKDGRAGSARIHGPTTQ
ncbi:DUF6368 family protein [Kitasatospora aureofaciens]|uniref:DUF6368 family protein n=1 Tax=Kitasatospora aureofaciens TaxID=1894 RepID=UPI0033AD9070